LKTNHKKIYTLRSYKYTIVTRKNIVNSIQLSGIMAVSERHTILAPQTGVVEAIKVSEGDSVKKGQGLAIIYSKKLYENLSEKQKSLKKKLRSKDALILQHKCKMEQNGRYLKRLKAKENKAFLAVDKYKKIYNIGAASLKQVHSREDLWKEAKEAIADQIINAKEKTSYYKLQLENLEIDIKNLQAQIRYLNKQIEECSIHSPIHGQIIDCYELPGNYITQYSKIMTIADLSKPLVKLKVSENQISRITVGQKVILSIGNHHYRGYVHKIDLKAVGGSNTYSSTVNVKVHFIEKPNKVIPGSSISAEIILGHRKNALYLPRGPYLVTGSEHYVYKIRGDSACKVEVDFGIVTSCGAEILGGLQERDRVIISGYQEFINFNEINLDGKGGIEIDNIKRRKQSL